MEKSELAEPLTVSLHRDCDGEHLLYFMRNGVTVKCGYVFPDAALEVQERIEHLITTVRELQCQVDRLSSALLAAGVSEHHVEAIREGE